MEGGLLIGVPKEIKDHEGRVGLVPAAVRELAAHGHRVLIQSDAGRGAGIFDDDFVRAGATVVNDAGSIWSSADLIVKVKEPLAAERKQLHQGQVLFTYLHLAPDPDQANDLMRSHATCIAYETVTDPRGTLPLLTPMSEVAGRMSVQVGAHCLENAQQGRGILLGGVPGVAPANVLVLGGGVAGTNAVLMAVGLGADVTVVDRAADALRRLVAQFGTRIKTVFPTQEALARLVAESDLVIGTILIPGAAAPKLITRNILREMKPGSVIVDVSIDQGGCAETSKPTTHSSPTYIVDGVIH
jgi:alanine dehydrogenase